MRIHSAFRTYDGASKIRPEKGVKIFKEEDRRVGVSFVRSAYICDPDNNVIEFIDLVRAPVERAYGSKQDPSQALVRSEMGRNPNPSLALARPVTPGADIGGESDPLGLARAAPVHVSPARSIFSNALNFCRSAIAVLVRSP